MLIAKRSANTSSSIQDCDSMNASRPGSTKNSFGQKQIKFDEDTSNISLIKGCSTKDSSQYIINNNNNNCFTD